jgi:hypothetical protein
MQVDGESNNPGSDNRKIIFMALVIFSGTGKIDGLNSVGKTIRRLMHWQRDGSVEPQTTCMEKAL